MFSPGLFKDAGCLSLLKKYLNRPDLQPEGQGRIFAATYTMLSENLPNYARVWIYQADRVLNDDECTQAVVLRQFLTWTATNGTSGWAEALWLFSFYKNPMKRGGASGVSIDKSIIFIRDIGRKLNVDFCGVAISIQNGDVIRHGNLRRVRITDDPGHCHDIQSF